VAKRTEKFLLPLPIFALFVSLFIATVIDSIVGSGNSADKFEGGLADLNEISVRQ
jgi:hypothetical protein